MTIEPDRWVDTVAKNNKEVNSLENKINPNKWVNTLPSISGPSISGGNSFKKYTLFVTLFIFGLMFVPIMKNETRDLEKEITNLKKSISIIKKDLHRVSIDHELITSPENISLLAKEYLEHDFINYKKSQIMKLTKESENLLAYKKENKGLDKDKKISKKLRVKIEKKVVEKKKELKKLQELYSSPEKLPDELKVQVAKKIKKTKGDLEKLYSNPAQVFDVKMQRWAAIQFVKAIFGIPIVPGK